MSAIVNRQLLIGIGIGAALVLLLGLLLDREVVGTLLGIFGLLGFLVGLVWILVALIRRKRLSRPALVAGGSFVVLIIGSVLAPSPDPEESTQVTAEPTSDVANERSIDEEKQESTMVPQSTTQPTSAATPITASDPSPLPTSTPRPTPAPIATPAPPAGLGISRFAVQSIYEQPDIGFVFESSPLFDGTPRTLGESPDGIAIVELIGEADNLSKAYILIGLPNDNPGALALNAVYLLGFPINVVPGWSDGTTWVSDNLETAIQNGTSTIRLTGGKTEILVELEFLEPLGFLSLSISAIV